MNEEGGQREALSLENTLWANTVLASSGYVLAIIVYTGIETRAQMGKSTPDTKVGKLDLEINRLSKFLFIFMVILSVLIVGMGGFIGKWWVTTTRFVLLLSAIIPISMRVNLDLGKVYYSWCIAYDQEIPGTIPRTTTIPEELGRVQFLLTDKTGTLTKNDMIFKKLNMEYASFDLENLPDLRKMLNDNCQERRDCGPMADVVERFGGGEGESSFRSSVNAEKKTRKKGGMRREQNCVVRDFVTALALCHNVTPTFPDENDKTTVEF